MDWQLFNDYSALMQVIITFILVGITWKYVRITNNILIEQEKARKISFIERRLEKLYYPLKNFIEDPALVPINDNSGYSYFDINMEKFYKIVPYEYLMSSNDSKDKIREFINKLTTIKQEDFPYHGDLIIDILLSKNTQILKEIIDQDIQTLQDELNKLV